ncbi:MAG: divergent polysaccharide deacetylase family protein [Candidatus Acidiferrales bacterium]
MCSCALLALFFTGCTKKPARKARAKKEESEARSAHRESAARSTRRLAIIIDDMGNDRTEDDAVIALPYPLTVSVLPHLPLSTKIADEAARRGDEVMLHLPMQPDSATTPHEAVELRPGMSAKEVRSVFIGMLNTVPHAAGVNNHEGSKATADPQLMDALMPALRERGLFFVDSRTTASTVAYDTARHYGVHAASRKVFLDDSLDTSAIQKQIDLAVKDTDRDGQAIAIGHPHPETTAALREMLPQLKEHGIQLVFASDLVK